MSRIRIVDISGALSILKDSVIPKLNVKGSQRCQQKLSPIGYVIYSVYDICSSIFLENMKIFCHFRAAFLLNFMQEIIAMTFSRTQYG